MSLKQIVTKLHVSTKRDYLARVNSVDKAWAAEKAGQWGADYWDGSRDTGYGGYSYDGRWVNVAQDLINIYSLQDGAKILDIGSGKGFLLHDLKQINPSFQVSGIDASKYAIENCMDSVRATCIQGCASSLPFEDQEFDLVISINTLHNLNLHKLWPAMLEMNRVSKDHQYLCVEAYRNEKEKANLLYWQLTCRAFFSPEDWNFLFEKVGYSGDFEYIYFE
ncbi:class I SAM-dependent methyltransferase [Alphaproteobacteria bacterium LSUCC0226]